MDFGESSRRFTTRRRVMEKEVQVLAGNGELLYQLLRKKLLTRIWTKSNPFLMTEY